VGLLGIVSGHSIDDVSAVADRRRVIDVDGARVEVFEGPGYVLLPRHGTDGYTLPHRIDHPAHARALAALRCDAVLALSSVGSLRDDLGVGAALVPHDFVAFGQPPRSVYDDRRAHVVPAFEPSWRRSVVDAWQRGAPDLPLRDGGVYCQLPGPRFETAAEIRVLASFADVVGMTAASECVAMCEVGLPYAVVCVVDNLANGVGAVPLTYDEFLAGVVVSRERVASVLGTVAGDLVGSLPS
jgi:5'-methylthioadenosine phosphorylase